MSFKSWLPPYSILRSNGRTSTRRSRLESGPRKWDLPTIYFTPDDRKKFLSVSL